MKKAVLIWSMVLVMLSESSPDELLLSPANRRLLAPEQAVLQSSSAVIVDELNVSQCYGVVVSADGYVFTKASVVEELESFKVRVGRESYRAEILKGWVKWDVVLLKLSLDEGDVLSPVLLRDEVPELGDIVVSNGVTSLLRRRLKFGVVSAQTRAIPAQVSTLDFYAEYDADSELLVVRALLSDGESVRAGLKEGDVLLSIDGQRLAEVDGSVENIYENKWPGEVARVQVRRGRKEHFFQVPYQWKHKVFPSVQDRNEAMSGRISGRRTGFPEVIQHDIPLSARSVGGPLLNLEGSCVGMNISRYSRAETYAIPASALQRFWKEYQAGL